MHFLRCLTLFLFAIPFARGSPIAKDADSGGPDYGGPDYGDRSSCRNPRKRTEWRKLPDPQKKDYIRAVNCLQNLRQAVYADVSPGVITHFEDFAFLHKIQTPYIHLVGQFLPWHRYLVWVYETALRDQCGYKGAQPYWDFPLDSTNLLSSPVFSPTTGFGGNGDYIANQTNPIDPAIPPGTGGGCVLNGPFQNWTIHLGRNTSYVRDDRCLERNLNPTVASFWMTRSREAEVYAQTNFWNMSVVLEGFPTWLELGVHGGGHILQGGTALDIFTSNAEPLFYLLHTYVDRIWWRWQKANLEERLYEVSGPIIPYSLILGPDLSILSDGNVTLDFTLDLGRVAEPWPVKKTMDIQGGPLCYEYD